MLVCVLTREQGYWKQTTGGDLVNIYDVYKSGDEYEVMLPPLHYSETDVVFFRGSHDDCVDRVESWKILIESWGSIISGGSHES